MNVSFPPHKAAMHITHNDYKSSYQSAREWVEENERDPSTQYADWISEEEKQKAMEGDSIWTLQWYPETPVGFQCVAASSFEALMAYFAQGADDERA